MYLHELSAYQRNALLTLHGDATLQEKEHLQMYFCRCSFLVKLYRSLSHDWWAMHGPITDNLVHQGYWSGRRALNAFEGKFLMFNAVFWYPGITTCPKP